MEPQIRYAKTADGLNIAYWALGEGMPVVHLPTAPFSHIQLECQIPEYRSWYDALGRDHMLVRYDNRGSGLSQRDVADYSQQGLLMDLEAVVDKLRLQRFAVFAGFTTTPVAIAYAARHPERVSHLILWCGWSHGVELRVPRVAALQDMMQLDWELYTTTLAHVLLGWEEGEPSRRFAAYIRECIDQPNARQIFHEFREYDAVAATARVAAPALVIHRREVPFPAVEQSRALAAAIPDSRLVLLEGSSGAPYLGDQEAVVREINAFLSREAGAAAPDGLSPRELQVLRLIALGKSNREIADYLVISENTVARHISHIFEKTGVANRAEAATYAGRHGVVPW